MDQSFLCDRIAATQALIIAAETAQAGLQGGTIEEYRLDTGQTITHVTRSNIGTLQAYLNSLYNLLTMLEARKGGGNTIQMRPGY